MSVVGKLPSDRRSRGKQEKLLRISAAAQALFREKGFDQTSTHEIADRADVGRGTVFLYVSAKEDLLILAFAEELKRVVEAARERLDKSASFVDQTYGFFCLLLDYHLADPELSKHLIREVGVLRNAALEPVLRQAPISDVLVEICRRAQATGEIRQDVPLAPVCGVLFSAYWNCLRTWASAGFDVDRFHAELRPMIEVVAAGLRAQVPPRGPR